MSTLADQHLEALAKGQSRRIGKATIRAEVRKLSRQEGPLRVAEFVCDPPTPLKQMYVFQLLQFAPGIKDVKARELLTEADISPWTKAGRLKVRERLALSAALTRFAAGVPLVSARKEPVPARKEPGPRCRRCGLGPLLKRGLCGFCVEEEAL